jgi:hypothetical protein
VVTQQMCERCHRPVAVEGEPLVRHRHVKNPARPQYAEKRFQRPDRVLAVFEKVIGNDEILRPGADRFESLAVVHDINSDQLFVAQVRVLSAQVGDGKAVDVTDFGARRHTERIMQRPDL